MTALVASGLHLPAMPAEAIERVRRLEGALAELPQVEIATAHLFHAGVYARTIRIPAGVALTGALIKVSTVLIFSGHATVLLAARSSNCTATTSFRPVLVANRHSWRTPTPI